MLFHQVHLGAEVLWILWAAKWACTSTNQQLHRFAFTLNKLKPNWYRFVFLPPPSLPYHTTSKVITGQSHRGSRLQTSKVMLILSGFGLDLLSRQLETCRIVIHCPASLCPIPAHLSNDLSGFLYGIFLLKKSIEPEPQKEVHSSPSSPQLFLYKHLLKPNRTSCFIQLLLTSFLLVPMAHPFEGPPGMVKNVYSTLESEGNGM